MLLNKKESSMDEMNVRKIINEYKFYDGTKKPMKLSASQVSKDLLELYLYHTEDAKPGVFGKGAIGSIFHMGMEEMFKPQPRVMWGEAMQEIRKTRELPNGWTIDGKMDLVDFKDNILLDWKGLSAYAYGIFKKNDRDHKINMQFAVYNWLLGGNFLGEAHCFITDWDPVKKTHPATAHQIVKVEMYEPEEIEAIMMDKTSALGVALAAKKVPAVCEDVMPRFVSEGNYINSKCAYYCDYAHACPKKKDQVAKTLGLKWGRS